MYGVSCTLVKPWNGTSLGKQDKFLEVTFVQFSTDLTLALKPFQSNFSATRILPSSYLFWAGKRVVGYL
jgi:hypothetical protein